MSSHLKCSFKVTMQSPPNLKKSDSKNDILYQPAASVSVHVAVHIHRVWTVIIDVDGKDAALPVAVLHDLKTVHGEGVQKSN